MATPTTETTVFVCEDCGYLFELPEDSDDIDINDMSTECPKCDNKATVPDIYHYVCQNNHVVSINVFGGVNPATSMDCTYGSCTKKMYLIPTRDVDSTYYCLNDACNNYLQKTISSEQCGGTIPTDSHKECDAEPQSIVDYPAYEEEAEGQVAGSSGPERRFMARLRHFNTHDNSGHGKGKRITSGHSGDRHQHGQNRKTKRKNTLAARVVTAYDELAESSSFRDKYKNMVDKLR